MKTFSVLLHRVQQPQIMYVAGIRPLNTTCLQVWYDLIHEICIFQYIFFYFYDIDFENDLHLHNGLVLNGITALNGNGDIRNLDRHRIELFY